MKHRQGKTLCALLVLTIVLGLVLTGCGAQEQAPSPVNGKDTIAVYTIADPAGDWGFPSPYAHYDRGPGILRMSFLFDTLVWRDSQGYVPALAASWEYLEEENAYLFQLRNNVKWHDGEAFTAEDVAFTFEYLKKHPYSMSDTSVVAGVQVLADDLVKIKLTEPFAPFINRIAGAVPILPKHIWQNIDNPKEFTAPEAVVGTGPFKFGDYNREQGSYLFVANHEYYLGKPKVEQLRFIKLNQQLAGAALKRGEINYTPVPPEMVAELENSQFALIKADYDWALKLMFNHTKEPLNNKDFRQGLAYAINRQELVDITKRGFALAGSPGLLSATSSWYNPEVKAYEYSSEEAMAHFAKAGYSLVAGKLTKEGDPVILTLLFDPDTEREAQLIKSQLEALGLTVQLKSAESKTRDALVQDWQFDLALLGHGGLGTDPAFFTQVIGGPSFHSARYTENERLNSLIKQQLSTLDEAKRKDLIKEIQRIYAEEMPCLALYYPDQYYAHDGQIQLYNTWLGIGTGIPLPLNKAAFVAVEGAS